MVDRDDRTMRTNDMIDDKPVGRTLGWERVSTDRPYTTRWMTLRQDHGMLPDGESFTYTYVEAAAAVFIVPVTAAGEVVLIRQYRYTVDAWCLEVPAGGAWDRDGEELIDVARDELREEIGGTCGALRKVGTFYPWASRSDQIAHVFLATDVELGAGQSLERTEQIEPLRVPASEALEWACSGKIHDGQSALALILCSAYLQSS